MKEVKAKDENVNPYAICKSSVYGKKTYYESLKPERKEKAYHFMMANYSNDDIDAMSEKEWDAILKKNKKEWNY